MADTVGMKALLVEDEGPVALLIEDMLLDLGCEIAASAADLDTASQFARTASVDFAVLDLNLNGSSAAPVAQILRDRNIPFLFSTGYGSNGLPAGFESYLVLSKPFVFADLREKIQMILRPSQQSKNPRA